MYLPREHTHFVSLQVSFIVEIDTLTSGNFGTNKRLISVEVVHRSHGKLPPSDL